MLEYAALVASSRALPDGLILVFQYPVILRVLRELRGEAILFSSRPSGLKPRERQTR